jgi:ubiquinone biosynthesis protein UbiJ
VKTCYVNVITKNPGTLNVRGKMPQTARETFELYRTKKYEPFLRGVRGTYLFDIEQVGSWFVAVDNGALTIDEAEHDADCVIRCSEQDFVDIVDGRRNLLTAALQGRVLVRGDVALAQKFHGLVGAEVEKERGAA